MEKYIIINDEKSRYLIYDSGKIINTRTNKELTGSVYNTGYRVVLLTDNNGVKKHYAVHRLVALYFLPNPDNLQVVNHKDGNKLNNDVSNLEWVTYSENTKHAFKNNLMFGAIGKRNKVKIQLDENWKQYLDTSYYVDKNGNVYNSKTSILLKPSISSSGYIRYTLRINECSISTFGHVMVMATWGEYICQKNEVINHIDGNKANNNIDNLEIVSKSENMLHAYYNLKKNLKSIFSIDQNNNIQMFDSAAQAAREMGVTPGAIWYALKHNSLCKKRYWKYQE